MLVENAGDDLDLSELMFTDENVTLVLVGGNLSASKTLLKSAVKIKARVIRGILIKAAL